MWTLTAFDGSGNTETLALTMIVGTGQAGNTITTICTWLAGTPSTDDDSSNDTENVAVVVNASTSTDGGGGDPDDPATIPFLDVVPFYANVLEYSLNSRLSTNENRTQLHYLRRDRELKGFREWATRRIQVNTSTTDRIVSGIETAELVFLESDKVVQLNAGATADVFLPDAKVVLLAGGEYSIIKVKNASATDNALTLITVVD